MPQSRADLRVRCLWNWRIAMRHRIGASRSILAGLALSAALLMPALAQAAPAFVTSGLNMRAGPGTEYPVVAQLEPGVQVEVFGCLEGYGWCDVAIGQDRGWVAGSFLQAPYYERREPLVSVAPAIGLPVVGFTVGNYWDSYYRNRPWYRERSRWDHYSPPPRRAYDPPGRPDWRHDGPGFGPGPDRHGPGFDRGGPGPRRDWDRPQPAGERGPGPDRGGPGGRGPEGWHGRGGDDRGGPPR
jgi:uncharacterized protein YraI